MSRGWCTSMSRTAPAVGPSRPWRPLTPPPWAWFGSAVATAGDRIVVSAPLDDDKGSNSGSVYVFDDGVGGWTETKLVASDGSAEDAIGESVDVSADRVVVGAFRAKAAYVFETEGGGWVESKSVSPGGSDSDTFGGSVGLSI